MSNYMFKMAPWVGTTLVKQALGNHAPFRMWTGQMPQIIPRKMLDTGHLFVGVRASPGLDYIASGRRVEAEIE